MLSVTSIPTTPGYDPIYVYDRMGEPNNNMLQQVLAQAEEKDIGVTFSTGMAAVFRSLCICATGW